VAEWFPAADNLRQIKEVGLEDWLDEQRERQALVEELLQGYNEGRSMSFYCRICTRMGVELIDEAIQETQKRLLSDNVDELDMKSRARILKAVIKDLALEANVDLSKK
jgi:hypothetical protein